MDGWSREEEVGAACEKSRLAERVEIDAPGVKQGQKTDTVGVDVEKNAEDAWMVVYAQKSIFSPAGLSVLTRREEGLPPGKHAAIERALLSASTNKTGEVVREFAELVHSLYEVRRD